tara:strand:+ start:1191 stop:1349 length:159 start_codon:yes stop_codon:yes gene_type:complete
MTTQDIIQEMEETLGREFTAMEQYEIKQRMANTPNGTEKEVIDAALSYILDM